MATVSISDVYRDVYAFLTRTYWEQQDEYDDDMEAFYNTIANHEGVFTFEPPGNLTLYDQEWSSPQTVDDTIDDLDDDEEHDSSFVCNWSDDDGFTYFTLLTKDVDEAVQCVTRTVPVSTLDASPDKWLVDGWQPILIKTIDNTKYYIWQSPVMAAYDFVDKYATWVTNYDSDDSSTDDSDESNENNAPVSVGESAVTTSDDGTPRFAAT